MKQNDFLSSLFIRPMFWVASKLVLNSCSAASDHNAGSTDYVS